MLKIDRTEYNTFIQDGRLNQLLEDDEIFLENAEAIAIGVVKDFLFSKYDMTTVLSDLDNRPTVKRWIMVIAIYFLYERVPDKVVPKRVVKNYDDTMLWLQKVCTGKASVDLPSLEDEDGGSRTRFRSGSIPRREHSTNNNGF